MQRIINFFIMDENDTLSEYNNISHLATIVPMAPFTPKSTSKLRSALHIRYPIVIRINSLRIEFNILLFVFKALHSEAPPYLCDLLNWYHPNRHLRSANTSSLVLNRNKTVKFGKRLMDTAAASLWNFLPDEIKCALTIMIFKKHLKTYLFT